MFRRLLVLAIALLLVGCCCKPRCNPCQNKCNPCQPRPRPPPGGGSGDTNCAVWATQDCDPNTAGVQSRDWLVREIRALAVTANQPQAISHCDQYLTDKNCKGNFNDGAGDCATPGVSNCNCLLQAYQAAQAGNWAPCITKLGHGH